MILSKILNFLKGRMAKDKPTLPTKVIGGLALVGLCFLLNYALENKDQLLIKLFFLLNPPKK